MQVMANLTMVATTDPGIVQRNGLRLLREEATADTSRRTGSSTVISVDGIETKQKYCSVCGVFRPPRSCHCVVCDNCVERFDHHCPWVGQCVGLRNYRVYVMFISSALLFFAYVLAFAWRRVGSVAAGTGAGVLGALRVAPETVALGLFGALAVWFLGGLVAFHCYLISVNQVRVSSFLLAHPCFTFP
ncbi:hypothetical protein Taro_034582 [Colocasia esculenta]|uniref:S-acyltransferase n=1 Tax=Colocasia esculenta TaxID=4460 RepID=A0A843W3B9_COLES|nr:hypothetical protein [Colocasia esculenta]